MVSMQKSFQLTFGNDWIIRACEHRSKNVAEHKTYKIAHLNFSWKCRRQLDTLSVITNYHIREISSVLFWPFPISK